MAASEEPTPAWGSLTAHVLRCVFAALPDAASRGACRRVCRHWQQVADEGHEVWQHIHCRRPTALYLRRSLACPALQREPLRQPASVPQLELLLRRQRAHLRRMTLEENATDGGHAAAAMAAVLAAVTSEGTGLTDLTLVLATRLPDRVLEVVPGSATGLTSLVIRPQRGYMPSLCWAEFDRRLAPLHSLSLTGRFYQLQQSHSLSQLTALTRLRLANAATFVPDAAEALLGCPNSLVRLELSGLALLPPDPQPQPAEPNGILLPAPAAALIEQLAGGLLVVNQQAAAALPVMGTTGALLLPRWQQLEHLRLHNCHLHDSVVHALPRLPQLTFLHLSARTHAETAMAAVQRCSRLQDLVLGRLTGTGENAFQLPAPAPGALTQLTRIRCKDRPQAAVAAAAAAAGCLLHCFHLRHVVQQPAELRRGRHPDTPTPPARSVLTSPLPCRLSGCDHLSSVDDAWCSLPNLLRFEVESCDRLVCPNLAGLSKVEQLVFSHQRLEQLPDSITGLTTLTRLAVAACSLRFLCPGPFLRGLREVNLFANGLRAVPEALAYPDWGPTALQMLDLSSNHSHFLSNDDVAVLGQLRTLTSLRLGRQEFIPSDAHPAGPLAALRAALPNCQIEA